MSWSDKLKEAGVSIHVIATGGGAGLQQLLWGVPGSSAYLSGASFPYSGEEQEELLGFMPEHFCSEEAAIDLASAAYMKAYKFGGKKPVGLGITASVASEKIHRGEHRVFACIITDDQVRTCQYTLEKGAGSEVRLLDGETCDDIGFLLLAETLALDEVEYTHPDHPYHTKRAEDKAKARFFERPFFAANGKRLATLPTNRHLALMPGAYNPPHEGHLGTAQHVMDEYGRTVVFEVTAEPPHKEALSAQSLLQRAKLLQGYDRLFTRKEPFYIDKARAYPGIPLVLGADAMVRMLDPKWGLDLEQMFKDFQKLETKLLVTGRMIGDKFVTVDDISKDFRLKNARVWGYAQSVMLPVSGRFDVSSTELRSKLV
jgi:nicotinic acid mononucleotide adenylyltransferase/nicotinamide mononucleotide (NMN) deamidase PncC